MPYENESSVYFGNCALIAADGYSGSSRPLAASSPVQSWAARTTSGASATATVARFERIEPKSFETTLTVAPLAAAQSPAIFVTAGARFASVQMTMLVAFEACVDAEAVESAAPATSAAESSARAAVRHLLTFMRGVPPSSGRGRARSLLETVFIILKQSDPTT